MRSRIISKFTVEEINLMCLFNEMQKLRIKKKMEELQEAYDKLDGDVGTEE